MNAIQNLLRNAINYNDANSDSEAQINKIKEQIDAFEAQRDKPLRKNYQKSVCFNHSKEEVAPCVPKQTQVSEVLEKRIRTKEAHKIVTKAITIAKRKIKDNQLEEQLKKQYRIAVRILSDNKRNDFDQFVIIDFGGDMGQMTKQVDEGIFE